VAKDTKPILYFVLGLAVALAVVGLIFMFKGGAEPGRVIEFGGRQSWPEFSTLTPQPAPVYTTTTGGTQQPPLQAYPYRGLIEGIDQTPTAAYIPPIKIPADVPTSYTPPQQPGEYVPPTITSQSGSVVSSLSTLVTQYKITISAKVSGNQITFFIPSDRPASTSLQQKLAQIKTKYEQGQKPIANPADPGYVALSDKAQAGTIWGFVEVTINPDGTIHVAVY